MSCNNKGDEIAQGADLSVKIQLKDEDNNDVDGTLLDKLIVKVYHVNKTEIAKFSKNAAAGYELIDMTNAAAGEIGIKLLTTHTMAAPTGKILFEVHGQISDGSLTDDGVLDIIKTDQYLCTIIKSTTGGVTLP